LFSEKENGAAASAIMRACFVIGFFRPYISQQKILSGLSAATAPAGTAEIGFLRQRAAAGINPAHWRRRPFFGRRLRPY